MSKVDQAMDLANHWAVASCLKMAGGDADPAGKRAALRTYLESIIPEKGEAGRLQLLGQAMQDELAYMRGESPPAASPVAPTSFQQWGEDIKRIHAMMLAAFNKSVGDGSSYEFNSFDAGYTAGITDGLQEAASPVAASEPIDMMLHCPKCGMQHVDGPEGQFYPGHTAEESVEVNKHYGLWTNPPHKSHLCHGCEHIWRPADVPTNGVAAITTKGKADSPVVAAPAGVLREALEALEKCQGAFTGKHSFLESAITLLRSHLAGSSQGVEMLTDEEVSRHWQDVLNKGYNVGGRSPIHELTDAIQRACAAKWGVAIKESGNG